MNETLADEILAEVLDWASIATTCDCGAVWNLDRARDVIARTPYLEGPVTLMLTRAERETEARKRVCPHCRTEANRPCRYRNPGDPRDLGLSRSMKGVHAERLALVPATATGYLQQVNGTGEVFRSSELYPGGGV